MRMNFVKRNSLYLASEIIYVTFSFRGRSIIGPDTGYSNSLSKKHMLCMVTRLVNQGSQVRSQDYLICRMKQ